MTWVTKCPEKGALTLTYSRFDSRPFFQAPYTPRSLLKRPCSGPNRKFMLESVRQALRGRVVLPSRFNAALKSCDWINILCANSPPDLLYHQVFKETLAQQRRRHVCSSFTLRTACIFSYWNAQSFDFSWCGCQFYDLGRNRSRSANAGQSFCWLIVLYLRFLWCAVCFLETWRNYRNHSWDIDVRIFRQKIRALWTEAQMMTTPGSSGCASYWICVCVDCAKWLV